jgi:superfamily I DNA/RNA helicase
MPFEDRPITDFLPDQQKAADDRGGHARLLAGPGTGKTRTLVELVRSLICDGSLPGGRLCLTSTRAAAAGLHRKIRERLGSEDVPEVSTFDAGSLRSREVRLSPAVYARQYQWVQSVWTPGVQHD